jgi:hypothetical protein
MLLLDCSSLVYLPIASLIIHLFSVHLLVHPFCCSLFRFFAVSHKVYECSCFIYAVQSLLCCACYFEESLIASRFGDIHLGIYEDLAVAY